jgi:hypothetical protein
VHGLSMFLCTQFVLLRGEPVTLFCLANILRTRFVLLRGEPWLSLALFHRTQFVLLRGEFVLCQAMLCTACSPVSVIIVIAATSADTITAIGVFIILGHRLHGRLGEEACDPVCPSKTQ